MKHYTQNQVESKNKNKISNNKQMAKILSNLYMLEHAKLLEVSLFFSNTKTF